MNFNGYNRCGFNLWENQFRNCLSKGTSYFHAQMSRTDSKEIEKARFPDGRASFPDSFSAREYFNSITCFSPEEVHRLLGEDFTRELCGYDPFIVFHDLYQKVRNLDPFSRMQYVDMKTYLPDSLLAKVDRSSMAHSLEVRLPMLDHRLIEFFIRVPIHFKIRGLEEKYVLRKAFEGILPSPVLSSKKQRITLPLQNRLVDEILNNRYSPLSEILNVKEISSLWHWHQKGKKDYSRQIWAVLLFQKWHHTHMSGMKAREEDPVLVIA